MKKNLLYALLITAAFLVSCGDDEPNVNPIVGTWELFNASRTVTESGFDYLNFNDQAALFGESNYSFEFQADGTYERRLQSVLLIDGSIVNIDDSGTWELDGDDLDLDVDGTRIGGLSYQYTVEELEGNDMRLAFFETSSAFPQSKVLEWFDDGTLDKNGEFTVTDEEYDSLRTNFEQDINYTYSIKFDKQ